MRMDPANYFRFANGKAAANLHELRDALAEVDDAVFSHHVNAQRNDFAAWIRDVLGRTELAEKVMAARSKTELLALLEAELAPNGGVALAHFVASAKELLLALRELIDARLDAVEAKLKAICEANESP